MTKESLRQLTEGTKGVKEVALSSSEIAKTVGEINKNLQQIQQVTQNVDHGVVDIQSNIDSLMKMESDLKQLVSIFKVE